jgi:hypothetical protein
VPSLVSYLTGLAFYATHFPECCFPGRFDWGGSHAVWHVFIVVGEFSLLDSLDVLGLVFGVLEKEGAGRRIGCVGRSPEALE